MLYLLMGKYEDCTLYPGPEDLKEAFKIGFIVNEDKEDELLHLIQHILWAILFSRHYLV
jgi:hypothetical protein